MMRVTLNRVNNFLMKDDDLEQGHDVIECHGIMTKDEIAKFVVDPVILHRQIQRLDRC